MRDNVKRWLDQLHHEETCWEAALKLDQRKPREAAPVILALLSAKMAPHTARCVVWLAGMMGLESAGERLVELLRDEEEDIEARRGAAYSLGKLKHADGIMPLVESLCEKELRWNAALALGRYPDKMVGNILVNCLRDRDTGIREGATWALGELGSQRTVSALEEASEDENKAVSRGAEWALRRMEHRRRCVRYRSLLTFRLPK